VARTALAAAAGTGAGALVRRLLGPVLGTGTTAEVLLLSAIGLTVVVVFVAVLHAVRAPERRLLGDAMEVVTLRRR
jgi:hypothetical protein